MQTDEHGLLLENGVFPSDRLLVLRPVVGHRRDPSPIMKLDVHVVVTDVDKDTPHNDHCVDLEGDEQELKGESSEDKRRTPVRRSS